MTLGRDSGYEKIGKRQIPKNIFVNMKDTEIEIQVKIENINNLLDFLKENGVFMFENRQLDEYFVPIHRDFTKVRPLKEWLRLRDSNGKYSINYKNWYFDENGKSYKCDECESRVENIDSLRKIFQVLNFRSIAIVEKLRKVWNYKDYEIAVDSVKDLGDFVEIEFKGDDERRDPKEITKEMINFLKGIGCGKIQRNYVGYPFQLLFPEEVELEEN